MDLSDGDSENDEDFVPDPKELAEANKEKDDAPQQMSAIEIARAAARKRQVDSIFSEMIQGGESAKMGGGVSIGKLKKASVKKSVKKASGVTKKKVDKNKMMRMLLTGNLSSKSSRASETTRDFKVSAGGTPSASATSSAASAAAVAKRMMASETVEEVVSFAGATTTVKKTVSAASRNPSSAAGSGSSSLDAKLASLKEPRKLTTMDKSSADWEQFKEKEGLGDELEQAAKNGYLEKQDFLLRVDHRTFEKERDERLLKHAKASKQ